MKRLSDLTKIITLDDLEKARRCLYSREARRRSPYKDPFHPPIGKGDHNKFSEKNICINDLYERCRNFQFNPYRGVSISKEGGGKRSLLVSSPEDRIVLTAMLPKIRKIIAQKTMEGEEMFGIGKNFSQKKIPHIIGEVQNLIHKQGYKYLTKIDFSNFFSTIDRKLLLQLLKKRYFDTRNIYENITLNFIKASLHNEIDDDGNFFCDEIKKILKRVGIPQGLPYSPMLASIYALDLDMLIKNLNGCLAVRYLDDLLILSKTKTQRDIAFKNFQQLVKGKKLKINMDKTEHINFTKQHAGVIFLGVHIVKNDTLVFLALPDKKKEKKQKKFIDLQDNSYQLDKHLGKPYYKNSPYYKIKSKEYIINKKIHDSIIGYEQYCRSSDINDRGFIAEIKRNFLLAR